MAAASDMRKAKVVKLAERSRLARGSGS